MFSDLVQIPFSWPLLSNSIDLMMTSGFVTTSIPLVVLRPTWDVSRILRNDIIYVPIFTSNNA